MVVAQTKASGDRKPDGRGGKREGAGRPKGYSPGREPLSVRQLAEFERAAKDMAKKHGKSLQEIVLGFAYDDDASLKDRLAASKLYWDKSVIHATEGGDADKAVGPAVFLPEKHPRLELVDGGKPSDEG